MAHMAEVIDGVVQRVLVIDAATLAAGYDPSDPRGEQRGWGDPANWVQVSYNTQGGVHLQGGTPLRKNYPGKNYLYDGVGFYAPSPYPSWTKNADTYLWEPPTPMPTDGQQYRWDEPTLAWVVVV